MHLGPRATDPLFIVSKRPLPMEFEYFQALLTRFSVKPFPVPAVGSNRRFHHACPLATRLTLSARLAPLSHGPFQEFSRVEDFHALGPIPTLASTAEIPPSAKGAFHLPVLKGGRGQDHVAVSHGMTLPFGKACL